MVRLTSTIYSKPAVKKFIDKVRIQVRGGRGGNGLPKFGGVGGKGGDVYVEGCDKYTLKKLKQDCPHQRFKAEPGEDSRKYRILGNPGKDTIVKCPLGVSVITDTNRNLGDLNKPGDQVLVALGGCGGGPYNNFAGQKGQVQSVNLDLKLLADVGFVGFPNAGKSTLLKALSKAKPKIANYPFTTIAPNIGILQYEDFRSISAADLPGLIEGAHLNFGMGHSFLKHCMRTKILLFVIDIDGFCLSPQHSYRTAFETVMYLNSELELYDDELVSKPAILAVNKIDQDTDGKKTEELLMKLKHSEEIISNFPNELKPSNVVKFDAIIPISAMDGFNISKLKDKIRTVIDIYYDKNLKTEAETSSDASESNKLVATIHI